MFVYEMFCDLLYLSEKVARRRNAGKRNANETTNHIIRPQTTTAAITSMQTITTIIMLSQTTFMVIMSIRIQIDKISILASILQFQKYTPIPHLKIVLGQEILEIALVTIMKKLVSNKLSTCLRDTLWLGFQKNRFMLERQTLDL